MSLRQRIEGCLELLHVLAIVVGLEMLARLEFGVRFAPTVWGQRER